MFEDPEKECVEIYFGDEDEQIIPTEDNTGEPLCDSEQMDNADTDNCTEQQAGTEGDSPGHSGEQAQGSLTH